MNTFTLEVWDDEGEKCSFYSVRKEDATMNETDKFFNRYYAIPELKTAIQQLMSFVLESIGNDHGAVDVLFNRYENQVVGLPNKGKAVLGNISFLFPNFPLRLYALRIHDRPDLVVLFNGGRKSAQTNQGSRDLHLKWVEACQFARRIEEALRNREILVDTTRRKLISADGNVEIQL
ncbi:MAG: hypothetical protein Q8939_19340 [Bacteroidota bacterium]|nr:hypothetical protein [Bacteroidota bacterium]